MELKKFYKHYFQKDPYSEIRPYYKSIKKDLYLPKAWGSESEVLVNLIDKVKPQSILEIGSWKGTSAVFMARTALKHNPNLVLVCVDTWLSSNPLLWRMRTNREKILTSQIEKSQYGLFLSNILHSGLEKIILPFRNTSSSALDLLYRDKVSVDFTYIDAGHSEEEVYLDIVGAWKITKPGGVIVGDDFTSKFEGVKRAARKFSRLHKVKLHTKGQKWWMFK